MDEIEAHVTDPNEERTETPQLATEAMRTIAEIEVLPEEVTKSLMTAQADFIVAQELYIHNRDLTALLRAQVDFINVQGYYIAQSGDILHADVQEQIIGIQFKALRQIGAI